MSFACDSDGVSRLSDGELLSAVRILVEQDRRVEADLVEHLGEIDARRLYRDEGHPSMFAYCTRVLHFSESSAYHRIAAARAARAYPMLLDRLRSGDLHLTALVVLAPHLTHENHVDLVRRSVGKTRREVETFVANLAPRPAVPSTVRKLPEVQRRGTVPLVTPGAAVGTPAPITSPPKVHPQPLGEERYRIQFTAGRETHRRLQELRALMRHQVPDGDVGAIVDRALVLLLEEVRRRRFGAAGKQSRRRRERAGRSRHIPLEIRRAVLERDAGRCQFVGRDGTRCGSRDFIELHHVIPWARSGEHSVENLTLLCRAHNLLEGERVFGERQPRLV